MLYGVAPALEKPMIICPRPGVLQLLFVMRGSIMPRIAPPIIGFGPYSTIGVAENELALDSLCRVCEIAAFEALGPVPRKLLPPHHHRYT